MRVVLLLAALLVVSLAGCVSEDDPEPAGPTSTAAKDPNEKGSDEPTPAPGATPTAPGQVVVVEPYQQTFEGSGSTSTGVWVCNDTAGTGECNGHEISEESRIVTFDYPDHLTAATLVMTWERLDNTYRFLVAEVRATPADGGEAVLLSSGHSTSPYEVTIPEADVGPGTLEIEVRTRSDTGAGPAFLFADPQTQPFDIEATLTMMPSR